MEAKKYNLPHDAHFPVPCGGPAPYADVRSPRVESQLRMQVNVLRMWRYHLGVRSCLLGVRRPCSLLRMRRYLLGVRRPCSACGGSYLLSVQRLCSACGGSVMTCGDLFFKQSQPSHFITIPVLIVASTLAS